VKLDLAGVRPEDVTVQANRSEIRVVGVRRDRFAEKGFRHHSLEISYSRFERTVPLPCRADSASMRVEYQEGMLIVFLDTESGERG
jgi:HSP20 family molecular chaperone IbpA